MNARAKGRKNELRAKRILEAEGYTVEMSSPGQKFSKQVDLYGLWDAIGVRRDSVRCVQVKTNRWASGKDTEAMRSWECPENFSREIWRFNDGSKIPQIRVL